jgi:hypothetical protein
MERVEPLELNPESDFERPLDPRRKAARTKGAAGRSAAAKKAAKTRARSKRR